MYPFGCSFLICPAGWPAGWDWLLPGVMPIPVQAHKFNRHQPEALPAAFLPPPPPQTLQPRPWQQGWGQEEARPRRVLLCAPVRRGGGGGGVGVGGGGGGGRVGGVGVWRKSGIILVLELALDHLGLVATAGAHNRLDILVIGCQDVLKLRLEGVRLHFGVYFHHCTLVLKCSCIHAVLEI